MTESNADYRLRLAAIRTAAAAVEAAAAAQRRAERAAAGEPLRYGGGRGSRWWLNQGRHGGRSYRA